MTGIANAQQAEEERKVALSAMRRLDAANPGEAAFQSIINQLDYLAAYLPGTVDPIPKADSFTFGFLGVRFVREYDPETSERLAQLSQYIKRERSGARRA